MSTNMNDERSKLDDLLDAVVELHKLSDDEKYAMVRAFVEEDLAERLRRGEIVVVGTAPDGTHIYQKASELENDPE